MTKFINKQIGELFTFDSSKCIYHAINLPIIKPKPEKGYYRYVVRSAENNGINGYISKPTSGLNPGNTISCAQDTAEFFYQSESYFTGNKVKVMNPIGFKLTQQIALYLLTVIKQGFQVFGWGSSYNVDVMKKVKIQVPVTATGALDTDYMASYVRKIEASYVRKIEAYLSVLGYKSMADVKLTDHEQKLLAGGIQAQPTSKFRVGDLLEFHGIPQAEMQVLIPTDNTKAGIPYVVQSINNNMVSRFVNKKYIIDHGNPLENGDAIVLGVTLPAVSYQVHEFSGSQLIVGRLKSKYPKLNAKIGNYLVTILDKQMYQFSYAKKPGIKVYKRLLVKIPVTSSGDPDWQFMSDYITAIEKLKVLKLKQFLDHKLDLYQQAIK